MATTESTDVVVIGGGVMGAATAWQLSRAGRRVVVLEQFGVGDARASSSGRARVFRVVYEDPEYVRMALESKPMWRDLERDAGGEGLLVTLGGVDVGPDLSTLSRALSAGGARFEQLDPVEAAKRFPRAHVRPHEEVIFQPDAGIVMADRAVAAFLGAAVGRGARVVERTAAQHLSLEGDGVSVRTKDGSLRANVAVVTAGAWVRGLVAQVGIDLPVTPSLETVAFFPIDEEMDLTIFVDRADLSHPLYSLPSPGEGLKAGAHHTGHVADPREGGSADPEIVRRLSEFVAERCPEASSSPSRTETCFYTNTGDERFLLERHGPIVVGSACSGHGFKFAPLIGKRVADLVFSG